MRFPICLYIGETDLNMGTLFNIYRYVNGKTREINFLLNL